MRPAEPTRRVSLPGGYVDHDGAVHTEVEIATLTGAGEEAILAAPPDLCAAALTTMVLAHSIRRIDGLRRVTPAVVRNLLVQDREFLIARLREATFGPDLWVRLECPASDCGQSMELQLSLPALPVVTRRQTSRYIAFDDALEFRLPTGDDQERIAGAA